MLMFWGIAAVLLVGVLALLIPPLLRAKRTGLTDARAEKLAIYRQQFDELEQDRGSGVLGAQQYGVAKSELEHRMLEEAGDAVVATGSQQFVKDRRLAVMLLLVLPLAAVLLYLKLGNPLAMTHPATPPIEQTMAGDNSNMAGEIEPLLEALRKKLENNPGDGAGWALLARSYMELRRPDEAVSAYEKAVKVLPDDPQLLADYADALAVVNGRKLAGKPEELINRALKLNPHHIKALMLAATAAFDRKAYTEAIGYWERLQRDLPAGSEMAPEVATSLDEARALSGQKGSSPPVRKAAPSAGIVGTVRIAPALAGKIDPSATLFVFARATQGPPMPLAIVRATVRDLPYHYRLDDSAALMPGHKLSEAREVVLVARISKSSDAKPQAGDLQGMTAAVQPDGRSLDIEINQVLP
jgi:cytochrome c-type biogenesis protein CcmH